MSHYKAKMHQIQCMACPFVCVLDGVWLVLDNCKNGFVWTLWPRRSVNSARPFNSVYEIHLRAPKPHSWPRQCPPLRSRVTGQTNIRPCQRMRTDNFRAPRPASVPSGIVMATDVSPYSWTAGGGVLSVSRNRELWSAASLFYLFIYLFIYSFIRQVLKWILKMTKSPEKQNSKQLK